MRFLYKLLIVFVALPAAALTQPETPSVTVTPSGGNVIVDTVWNKSHTSATFAFTAPDNSDQGRIYVIFTDDVSGSWSDANNPIRSESITPGGESITGYSGEWDDILFDANVNGKEFYWAIRCVNIGTFQDIDTLYSKLYTIQNTTPDAPDTPDLKSESDTGTSSGDNVTKDNTPTFLVTGLNPTYTAVRLRQWYDGTLYTSETIDGATQKNLTITDALSDGTHYIHAEHVDQYGNEAFSSYITIYIDTQAPNAPQVPDLKSSSDTGWQSDDDYTNEPTPTFTIALSESEYNGYAGISIDGTATDSSTITSGDYSSDDVTVSSSLSSGSYNITAFHRDRAGNKSSDSGPLSITVDRDSPSQPNIPDLQTASDGGFSSSDEITSNTTPTFDVSGVAAGDSIYVLFAADTVARDLASSTNISLTVSSAQSDGTYAVKAGAKDKAGNTATVSTSLSVTIDTQAPAKPGKPDLDSGSDSGASSTDDLTNDSTPAFDLTGLSSGDSVYIRFDGGIVTRTLAQGATIPDLEVSQQADGTYSVTVTATDAAGNAGTASDALTLRIDTAGPNAPSAVDMLATDDSGESSSDDITSNRQPRFTVSGVTAGDSVLLKFGGQWKAGGRASGSTIQLQPSAQLDEGTYSVTSTAIDSAGNESNASGALSVTIDFTASSPSNAPDLTASSDKGRSSSDNITSDTTVVFYVDGVTGGDSVFIELSGTKSGGAKVPTGETSVNVTVQDINEGTYTVTAYTKDPAGNVGSDSPALNSFVVDTTPPNAPSSISLNSSSDTGISDSDRLTQDRTPTFTISGLTATDSILLKVDGTVRNSQVTTGASLELTPTSNLSQGTRSVVATAVDVAGNQSNPTSTLTLRIDFAAPEPPNPPDLLGSDDSGFSNMDNYSSVTQPSFILTNLSSGTRDSVRILADGTTLLKAAVVSQGTADTLQIDVDLSEGSHTISAVAIDSAGNASTSSQDLALTIDTTDPDAPSAIDLKSSSDTGTSDSDDLTKDTTPTFTITGLTVNDSVFVTMTRGVTTDTVGRGKATNTTADLTVDQIITGSDSYTFQTYQMDQAGNTSSLGISPSITVTLDTQTPSAPTVDLLASDDSGMSSNDDLTKVTTPTFRVSGLTTTDSVYLVAGTDTVARGIANASTLDLTSSQLAEGTVAVKALARDYAGNLSNASSTLSVTIDATAPNPPAQADLLPAYDSGFFDDDDVTKESTLGFVIAGLTDGDSVTFYVNSVQKTFNALAGYTAPIASSSQVGLVYTSPSEDTLVISSTVTDSAGNTSNASGSVTVIVDQTLPTAPPRPDLTDASDSGTNNSDNITKDQTPSFLFSSVTSGDSLFVVISKGGESDTTGKGFASGTSLTITVDNLTTDAISDDEGTFTFSSFAVDSAGNISLTSPSLDVTVDVTNPGAPSIILVPSSDSGISNSDYLTNNRTPQFSITSVAATDSVYLVVDSDTTARDEVGSGEDSIVLTSTSLAHNPGGYSVKALSKDIAGNLGSPSTALTVRIDTDPPVTPSAPDLMTASDWGFSDTDNITSNTSPEFIITGLHATDRDSVRILFNGTMAAASIVSQGARDTLQVSTQVSGSYDVTVVVIDSAGNVSDTSASLLPWLKIDNAPPSAPSQPDLLPASDLGESSIDNLTSVDTPTFQSTGLEVGSINKLYRIASAGDTTLTKVDTVGQGQSSLTFTPDTPLPGNQYTFFVTSEDTAGNLVQSANLDGVIIDTEIPTAQIALTDSLVRTEDSPVTVTVVFSEGMADPPMLYALFKDGDIQDTTAMTPTAFDSVWQFSLGIPDSNDGTATISIIGTDNAGNVLDSLNVTGRTLLRLDNTDPVLSGLAPDSVSYVNNANVSYTLSETAESGSITWSWVSGVQDGNSPHVAVLQWFELAQAAYDNIQLTNDPTLTPTPLINNAYYSITWAVTDSAGNTSGPYVMTPVKYDTSGPSVVLTYSSYLTSEDSVVTITASFPDDDPALPTPQISILYAAGFTVSDTDMTIGIDSTEWTYGATIPAGNTGYATVTITATDLAGNSLSADSVFFTDTLLVDNDFPTVDSLTSSDSLVKELDEVTFTVKFSEPMQQSPTIAIDYAGLDSLPVTAMFVVPGSGDSTWFYTLQGSEAIPDFNDGPAAVTINGFDLAGNEITVTNTEVLILDNTDPVFESITPDTGSFVNNTQVAYTISEHAQNPPRLFSGSVTWTPVDTGSIATAVLSPPELQVGTHALGTLADDPTLEDGVLYTLTFTGQDSAGNTGTTIVDSVTYDTTGPLIDSLVYSKDPAMAGDTVFISMYFNEIVPDSPRVTVVWPAAGGTESVDLDSTVGGAMLQWVAPLEVPDVSGIASVTIVASSAHDKAGNPIDSLAGSPTLSDSTWVIDSGAPACSLFYENLSQSELANLNLGKGGDQVLITGKFSEQMTRTPVPRISIQFADTSVTPIQNVLFDSSSTAIPGDSIWYKTITLPTDSAATGSFMVTLDVYDLAGNAVATVAGDEDFVIDNIPPAPFETGDVTPYGPLTKEGWYNQKTDSLAVTIPIDSIGSIVQDTTIYLGEVQIRMQIEGGPSPVNVGSAVTVDNIANPKTVYLRKDTIRAAFDPSDFNEGARLLTWARVFDRAGNGTLGAISIDTLVIDTIPPDTGRFVGGIAVEQDTIVSSDSISVVWSGFEDDTLAGGSGIELYQWAVGRFGSTDLDSMLLWTSVGPDTVAGVTLPLRHLEQYEVSVRAVDLAGNLSDTLQTLSGLLRLNSAPQVTPIDSQFVDEDKPFSFHVVATDVDTATLLGDTLHYSLWDTVEVAIPRTRPSIDGTTGLITWSPIQADTGSYNLAAIVDDEWGFSDTASFVLTVNSVNDTPAVAQMPDIQFQEDMLIGDTLSLNQYVTDDDDDTSEIIWSAVVMPDTANYPSYPSFTFGPGATPELQRTVRGLFSGSNKRMRVDARARTSTILVAPVDYSLVVNIDTLGGSSFAVFVADSNYYVENRQVFFIAVDPGGASDSTSISVTITPINDPPQLAAIPDTLMAENDTLTLILRAIDIDDSTVTFQAVPDSAQMQVIVQDSLATFIPQQFWINESRILVTVSDGDSTDTTSFLLDVVKVPRPQLALAIGQNASFTRYFELMITDTAEKALDITLTIDPLGVTVPLDTVGLFTWVGHQNFDTLGTFNFVMFGDAKVGDTTITRTSELALARAARGWTASSADGVFRITAGAGCVSFDRPFMIVDSTLFPIDENEGGLYRMGHPMLSFEKPVMVMLPADTSRPADEQAFYQKSGDGVWQEIPTVTKDGNLLAWTSKMGYFKIGEKTLFVPEATALRKNYPNPFNARTRIVFDVGFFGGPDQRVSMVIYNILGQEVKTLMNGPQEIGRHEIVWSGLDNSAVPVASGVYIVRLWASSGVTQSKKMMLLK